MKNKIFFELLVILIVVLSFTPFIQGGCSGGGGGGSGGDSSVTPETTVDADEADGAFFWDGTEWQSVDWGQVTAGLTDFEMAALEQSVKFFSTDTVYAVSDTAYYMTECTNIDNTGQCDDILKKSDDGGSTWETILETGFGIYAIDPIGSTLFVADHRFNVANSECWSSLYRSDDDGDNWENILNRNGYGLGCYIGETVFFNNEFFYNSGAGVTKLETGEVTSFTNGSGTSRLLSTDTAMYALSWGVVYETLDGSNWYEIGDDMSNIAVLDGLLYAFPE